MSLCQCHSCTLLSVSSVDPVFLFPPNIRFTPVSYSIVEVTFNGNLNVHVITSLAESLMSNTGSTFYYNCSTKDGQENPMHLSYPLPALGQNLGTVRVFFSGIFSYFLDSYQFEVTTKNVEFFPRH